ncbi:hypothetical protein Tco_0941700 [Tanacetum coccineum]|uniref:Uncharacterized protein n=1 Tax=Tanacetum coccineum TaxID=301880 RepID=A0ABQ5DRM5_9ASTR
MEITLSLSPITPLDVHHNSPSIFHPSLVQDVSSNEENKDGEKVVEKQVGNVQTSLTLSSAEHEIQSMVDVPIHQEDPIVQRTTLIHTFILMVTEKTTSTPSPPITQAQVQMCSTSAVGPHRTEGSYKDGDGDTWFQQSQVHSHMLIPDNIILKLKRFKKDYYISFQDKERYEHAGPKVTSLQVKKRSQDDDKRFNLADDLKDAQDQNLSCK